MTKDELKAEANSIIGRIVDREAIDEFAYDVIDFLENMEDEWIPSSTPPKFDEKSSVKLEAVIATTGKNVFPIKWCGRTIRGKYVERWETDAGIYYGNEIIAWKPYPKPPKENKE